MTKLYGKFAVIDLNTNDTDFTFVEDNELRRFFGGGGIAAKIFIDQGDDDAIVTANGLLTGFPVPTACKTSFIFKSPLTDIFGETSVGGKWGAELKKTGIDGLIIKGKSPHPVYLFVTDKGIEVRDAKSIWGMEVT